MKLREESVTVELKNGGVVQGQRRLRVGATIASHFSICTLSFLL
jgi:hypothetical protein